MFQTGEDPNHIVKEKKLTQITSTDQISEVVSNVIESHPEAINDYRNGKHEALNFLIAQVMKETKGKANPSLVKEQFLQEARK